MVKNRILTAKQKLFIDHLPAIILAQFYLTGGTALSAFYLEHRLSQDLDFFTDSEKTMPPIEFLTGQIKKIPGIKDLRFERLFDRRIFAASFEDGNTLKVEFTTYPFKSIEKRKKVEKLTVDSLLNIITGKLFALTDRYDPKDFVDLYFVLHRYDRTLIDLIRQTEERFGIKGLDFVIPERLLLVKKIGPQDLPVMLMEINLETMKRYFLEQCAALVKLRLPL